MKFPRSSARLYLPIAAALLAGLCTGCGPGAQGPAGTSGPALEITEQVQTGDGTVVARCSNGLTVIVKAVRSAPVVCVRCYVHTGSLYEREWLGCGLSHLVEHLVAQDAEHQGAAPSSIEGKPRTRVSQIGGQSNASTSMDCTQYYISAAAGKTMDCIDLIADWMARPEISEADFRREHGVVQRELEKDWDDPSLQMEYAHAENVFAGHPAAVPVIGYQPALVRLTYQDVLAYRRRTYTPQNMVFCVVGDVDVPAVLRRTCQAFAGFQRGRSVDFSLPEVQPLAGVRRVIRPHAALKDVMQNMSFITIPLLHEDLYALDLLATILGEGEASRLIETVQRRKQLVTSISCYSWTPSWCKGDFAVSFRAEPGKADAAQKAILEELEDLCAKDVTEEELTRAKRQKVAELVYSQQTVDSINSLLGSDYLATGDVAFSKDYTRKIQAVTAEQVRKAARKYFTFDRMAITRLAPPALAATAATGPATGGKSSAVAFTLPNGLRVVLNPNDSVGLVSMVFATEGGLLLEDEKTSGLGSLMAAMTTKGVGKLSAEQISQFFDQAGGGLSATCGNNSFYWQVTVLDDSADRALDILADVVLHPTFEANELDILRPQALAAIDQVEEQVPSQLMRFFRREFFTGSPYRLLPTGAKEVVKAATAQDLAAYHRANVKAGSSALAIYGRFDAAAVRGKVERLFADLPKGKAQLKIPPARTVADTSKAAGKSIAPRSAAQRADTSSAVKRQIPASRTVPPAAPRPQPAQKPQPAAPAQPAPATW